MGACVRTHLDGHRGCCNRGRSKNGKMKKSVRACSTSFMCSSVVAGVGPQWHTESEEGTTVQRRCEGHWASLLKHNNLRVLKQPDGKMHVDEDHRILQTIRTCVTYAHLSLNQSDITNAYCSTPIMMWCGPQTRENGRQKL